MLEAVRCLEPSSTRPWQYALLWSSIDNHEYPPPKKNKIQHNTTQYSKQKFLKLNLLNTSPLNNIASFLTNSSLTTNWTYSVSLKPGKAPRTILHLTKPPRLDIHTWTSHVLRAEEEILLLFTIKTSNLDHFPPSHLPTFIF